MENIVDMQDKRVVELHDRVNFAYQAHKNELVFHGSKMALYSDAAWIHAYKTAHRRLTTQGFTEEKLACLLALDNPLRRVANIYHQAFAEVEPEI